MHLCMGWLRSMSLLWKGLRKMGERRTQTQWVNPRITEMRRKRGSPMFKAKRSMIRKNTKHHVFGTRCMEQAEQLLLETDKIRKNK